MNMDILGYTIFALILISGLPLLLFALRRGKDLADKIPDESEWYDENGNHIYYDRKLIRYLEQKARKDFPCPQKQTEGSEPFDESRWYDENGNHLYYDRKIIRQQQKENTGKTPRM